MPSALLVAEERAGMPVKPNSAPYGSWKSPITSDLIVRQSIGLSEARFDRDAVCWLEGRPQEQGRSVVVRLAGGAETATDAVAHPFNVRTRAHEYGGAAWMIADGALYFSNFADGRLYRLGIGAGEPTPLTSAPPAPDRQWRYADGIIDHHRNHWIGVREDHTGEGEPVNAIVSVDLAQPGASAGRIVAGGHDFVSSPRLAPDGSRLAWLAWDHPNMPWNGTVLYLAELDRDGAILGAPRPIAGGNAESICQPEWSPDGAHLVFASDRSDWWNLYRYDLAAGAVFPIAPMVAEFARPHWQFGASTYSFAGSDRIVCSYLQNGLGRLAVIDLTTGAFLPVEMPFTQFDSVKARNDEVAFIGGAPGRPSAVILLDLRSGRHRLVREATDLLARADLRICDYLSGVETIEFPTSNERTAFALYYAPHNPDYVAPAGTKPPLLVRCHGGPTSAASSALNLGIQYWTSRGIAVLDVNYGGSTGFGRAYRERLHHSWGIVDVDDCVHGAKFLCERGLVDGDRMVISGGSAGGYTTLCALVFHDVFRGGASYYGVSDLAALAHDTHKFESRYLDWLIGPYPQEAELYRQRSPLFNADRLSRPIIFFQGDQDAVVPPSQTETMVAALRRRGVPVGYLLFSGEQHGFRKAENIQRALDAELYFYAVEILKTQLTF